MLCLILRTHAINSPIPGVVNHVLTIPGIRYDETLDSVITNINQFRGPEAQIVNLYNPLGQEIARTLWKQIVFHENLVLYLDQPNQ